MAAHAFLNHDSNVDSSASLALWCRYAPQELTNLLWCHASLGVQPPTPFLEAAVHALRPHLATCDASLVALAVHSLATLRYGHLLLRQLIPC